MLGCRGSHELGLRSGGTGLRPVWMRGRKSALPYAPGTALGYLHQPRPEEASLLGLLVLLMKILAAFDLNLLALSIMLP